MAKLTVKALSVSALPVIFQKLGPLAGKLMERLFKSADQEQEVPVDPETGSTTPPLLKKLIQELLEQAVRLAPLPPSLQLVFTQILARLDGVLMDLIWSALFRRNLVGAPSTSTTGVEVEPLVIPPEANGAYFAEFGEADGAYFAEFGEAIPGSGY